MKRFSFNDDEDEEEDLESDQDFMFADPSEFISMAQFENPDSHILNCAIKICEKSWFWSFYNVSTKIKMIREVFESLKIMIEGQIDA